MASAYTLSFEQTPPRADMKISATACRDFLLFWSIVAAVRSRRNLLAFALARGLLGSYAILGWHCRSHQGRHWFKSSKHHQEWDQAVGSDFSFLGMNSPINPQMLRGNAGIVSLSLSTKVRQSGTVTLATAGCGKRFALRHVDLGQNTVFYDRTCYAIYVIISWRRFAYELDARPFKSPLLYGRAYDR